jgi:hypothetical protein
MQAVKDFEWPDWKAKHKRLRVLEIFALIWSLYMLARSVTLLAWMAPNIAWGTIVSLSWWVWVMGAAAMWICLFFTTLLTSVLATLLSALIKSKKRKSHTPQKSESSTFGFAILHFVLTTTVLYCLMDWSIDWVIYLGFGIAFSNAIQKALKGNYFYLVLNTPAALVVLWGLINHMPYIVLAGLILEALKDWGGMAYVGLVIAKNPDSNFRHGLPGLFSVGANEDKTI